jgi:uncharacterized repeat protein (TIGR01451 family)
VTFDPDHTNNIPAEGCTECLEDTVVTALADLEIDKIGTPDKVVAGEQVKYTVTVTNHGPSDAVDVVVVDTLPAGVTYEVDTDSCVEGPAGTLTCSLGDMPAGATETFDIWVLLDYDLVQDSTLVNTATVDSQTEDPNLENNTDTADTYVLGSADLRITKYVSPHTPVRAGEQFTYTIIVDNLGPSRAYGVIVTDTLVTSGFVQANGCSFSIRTDGGNISPPPPDGFNCNFALATGVFDLGTMGANWLNPRSPTDMGRVIITINATADQEIDLTNVSTVTAETPDPDMSNNIATVAHSVSAVADLSVTKTAMGQVVIDCGATDLSQDEVTAGLLLSYQMIVTNDGPSRAENVAGRRIVRDGIGRRPG